MNRLFLLCAVLLVAAACSSPAEPVADAPGARSPVNFRNDDCAFDIRAAVAGAGTVTWAGVNLCEVKSVVLKRDPQAGAWVDYDE